MTPQPLTLYPRTAVVSSAWSSGRLGEERRRARHEFARPTLSTYKTRLDDFTVDVFGPEADRSYPPQIPPPHDATSGSRLYEGGTREGTSSVVEPRGVSAGLSLFTLLDPPETNLQSASPLPGTGVHPASGDLFDPLHGTELSIGFRHSGWKGDRRRVYNALRRTGQPVNRRFDFANCGRYAYVYQSVDEPDVYTIRGSTCHDRFCLPCGKERSRIIAHNVLDKLEHEQGRFLTLTLKSSTEPLADLLTKLTTNFAALRRTNLWKNKVTGGVAFLEVKWVEKTQRWHPHLHCLLQGRYIPRNNLSKTWHKVTGTSYIVDIRLASDNAYVTHYITKYASKPLDHSVTMQPDRLDELIVALKGKRLCMTFGTWRGYKLTEPPETGKWTSLGLLSAIIERAREGSTADAEVLAALSIDLAQSGIPPPPTTAKPVSSLTHEQHTILYPDRTTHLPDAYGTNK